MGMFNMIRHAIINFHKHAEMRSCLVSGVFIHYLKITNIQQKRALMLEWYFDFFDCLSIVIWNEICTMYADSFSVSIII